MASENGSQIQVPFDATGPNVALALDTANGRLTANLPMQSVSPGILLGAGSVPMLYDADTNLPLDLRNAAHSNGRVAILATGLGRVHPDWPAGVPAPKTLPPSPCLCRLIWMAPWCKSLALHWLRATSASTWWSYSFPPLLMRGSLNCT